MNNICNIFNIPCKAPLGIAGNGTIYIVLLLYKPPPLPSPPLNYQILVNEKVVY